MPPTGAAGDTLSRLDDATRSLVRLAATLAAGTEEDVREALQRASIKTPHEWIEELLLQTYLFAGFPRALNGMREWRRIAKEPVADVAQPTSRQARERGEATCEAVYGEMYGRLRSNIRVLHPLLDDWMIVEGYGKVLSRPGLDLARRELCIIAACAATGQDRQLQSHLHGARNVGVTQPTISEALTALHETVPHELLSRALRLWDRIRHDVH